MTRPSLLRWALWFALVAGLGQGAAIEVARIATNRLIWATPDVIWLAPLANAIVLTIAALALQVLTRGRKPASVFAIASCIFLFLSLIGPLLRVPRLHPYAVILLAAGLAVQGARMIRERLDSMDWLVRRTLPILLVLCIALGLGVRLKKELGARRAEAALPAATAGAPNVILIVLDTVRAQNLGLYGYQRATTPRLEEFARTGVVFERAFSTAPWTLPSHASFFTGRYPHDLTADWLTPLDDAEPTLAEALSSRGYVTVGFAANLIYATAESGLNRGFVRYKDFPLSAKLLIRESWLTRALARPLHSILGDFNSMVRKPASDVNAEFTHWLASRPDRPFFAFLNYFDAHEPYLPPPPFDTRFRPQGGKAYLNKEPETWSPEEVQQAYDAYDGTLAYLDDQVGGLLATLKTQGLLQNTLVVVTSDHGEQFGEHGLYDHGNSLYRPLLQVPLVVSFPEQVPAGVRISEPVSLINLSATILDLAKASRGDPTIPGQSLADHWRSPARPEKEEPLLAEVSKTINTLAWMPASKGDMKSVVVSGMHYIRNGDGREELYNLTDIAEERDLAGAAEYRPVLEEARRALKGGEVPRLKDSPWENEVDRN